jgi:hypothetical protein
LPSELANTTTASSAIANDSKAMFLGSDRSISSLNTCAFPGCLQIGEIIRSVYVIKDPYFKSNRTIVEESCGERPSHLSPLRISVSTALLVPWKDDSGITRRTVRTVQAETSQANICRSILKRILHSSFDLVKHVSLDIEHVYKLVFRKR